MEEKMSCHVMMAMNLRWHQYALRAYDHNRHSNSVRRDLSIYWTTLN